MHAKTLLCALAVRVMIDESNTAAPHECMQSCVLTVRVMIDKRNTLC